MPHGNACGINIFTQQFNFISEFSKTKQNIKKLLRPLDTEISLNATQKTSDEDTSKQIFWYIGGMFTTSSDFNAVKRQLLCYK